MVQSQTRTVLSALHRGEVPAVGGTERHPVDRPVMALEDLEFLARRRLPDPHNAIEARRGEVPAVGAERQAEVRRGCGPESSHVSFAVVVSQILTGRIP